MKDDIGQVITPNICASFFQKTSGFSDRTFKLYGSRGVTAWIADRQTVASDLLGFSLLFDYEGMDIKQKSYQ